MVNEMLFFSKKFYFFILISQITSVSGITLQFTNPKTNWISFFKEISQNFNIEIFVESGTYHGSTSAKAAQIFKEVHTIELIKEIYAKAKERFKNSKNVILYHGDSGQLLPQILSTISGKIFFWLDGHYMGGKVDEATPIIKELVGLQRTNKLDEFILIDDVRLFGTKLDSKILLGDKYYPQLEYVCSYLKNANNHINFGLMGDSLLVYDKRKNNFEISRVSNACFISRIYNGQNYSENEILQAELIISQAQADEREALKKMFEMYCTGKIVKCYHYILWYALLLSEEKNFEESNNLLKTVLNLGYDHWRIKWYIAQNSFNLKRFEESRQFVQQILVNKPTFKPAQELLKKIN